MHRCGKEGIRMKNGLMNNIGLKMLAFLTAFMLWFMVVNIDDPETTQTYHNIPVNVINEEVLAEANQTYQIVDDTHLVSVTVNANRSVLNKIKSENIVAVADMKELTLNTQIPIEVIVNGFEGEYKEAYTVPRNLQVRLEEEQTKKFPIVPATTGTVRDGYALGEIKAVPENISIRGPVSVISKISRVEAAVSVSGLSTDTILPSEIVLYDDENSVIDQSLLANNLGVDGVAVSVQLLKTKSVPLAFDTSEITAADGYSFEGITYEPREIQVSGVTEALTKIDKIEIPSFVLAAEGLTARTEYVVDITEFIPDTVRLVDANAGSVIVTVSIEKDGTRTFDISLGSLVVNGLSEDLTLKYETVDVLVVQVRGPKNILDRLRIDNSISIDLSDYEEAGSYKVPVEIELPEGCELEKSLTVSVILEKRK